MEDDTDHTTDTWHGDVRAVRRVENLLDRIAGRAVAELGVDVAVANARPDSEGSVLRRARSRASDAAVTPPPALRRGRAVTTPRLETAVWWAAGPATSPGVDVDLSGGSGPEDQRAPPHLELHAAPDFFGPAQLVAAGHFGAYASLSLLAIERVANLWTALETRGVISRAQGMLMERFGLGAEAAMALLRRWSQDSNCPVRDVALDLTLHGLPDPTPASGDWQPWTP